MTFARVAEATHKADQRKTPRRSSGLVTPWADAAEAAIMSQPSRFAGDKRPLRAGEAASSMPQSGRLNAASGARGGRVAMERLNEDADALIDLAGL